MSDTVTLAVVNDGGGRRVVGVKVVIGGRRGSYRTWERRGGRGSGVKWDFRACN